MCFGSDFFFPPKNYLFESKNYNEREGWRKRARDSKSKNDSKREREIFHTLLYFPDGHNGWGRTGLKSGPSPESPARVAGTQILGPFSVAFLSVEAGDGLKVEHLGLEPTCLYGMAARQRTA